MLLIWKNIYFLFFYNVLWVWWWLVIASSSPAQSQMPWRLEITLQKWSMLHSVITGVSSNSVPGRQLMIAWLLMKSLTYYYIKVVTAAHDHTTVRYSNIKVVTCSIVSPLYVMLWRLNEFWGNSESYECFWIKYFVHLIKLIVCAVHLGDCYHSLCLVCLECDWQLLSAVEART